MHCHAVNAITKRLNKTFLKIYRIAIPALFKSGYLDLGSFTSILENAYHSLLSLCRKEIFYLHTFKIFFGPNVITGKMMIYGTLKKQMNGNEKSVKHK